MTARSLLKQLVQLGFRTNGLSQAYAAAASIGAVVVPMNSWWKEKEMAYGLADSGQCAAHQSHGRDSETASRPWRWP